MSSSFIFHNFNQSSSSDSENSDNLSYRTARESFPAIVHSAPARLRIHSGSRISLSSTSLIDTIDLEVEAEDNIFKANPFSTVLTVFILYSLVLFGLYSTFPDISPGDQQHVKIPWNIDEAKALAIVLDRYTGKHYYRVMIGYALFYVFLQTFSIPGSIFLSLISGFLFSFKTAIVLVCFCSATGATGCYTMSYLVGRRLIKNRFRNEIQYWRNKVREEKNNLLNFVIFLRITPIIPNWFINIVAPLIGIPWKIFWVGTFLGVAPPSALAVHAGAQLNTMTSPRDHITLGSVIVLLIFAIIALLPVIIHKIWGPTSPPTT